MTGGHCKGPLSQYCRGTVSIPARYCLSTFSVLSQCCRGTIAVLSWYCLGTVSFSPVRYIDNKYCHVAMSTLLKNSDIDMVIFKKIDIDINKAILKNIDIDIDTDKVILNSISIGNL